jgi:chromosome segregation ATPase
MPEISEQVSEAIEKADEAGEKPLSKLNTVVATSVAIAATFMALCNVKAGNVVQAMGKTQVEIVDTWSFFQAKSTKQSLAEAALEQLQITRDPQRQSPDVVASIDKQLDAYRTKVARYDKEKNDLQSKVEELNKEYDRLNVKDDQFDISEALLSVAIALFGITALTQKKWMVLVAGSFGLFGFVVGLAGFVGWNIRPEWLAKLVGV